MGGELLEDAIRASLGDSFCLAIDAPDAAANDLRLIGPQELNRSGARAVRSHRMRAPQVPVLVIADSEFSADSVRDCYRNGASDVLHPDEIGDALARTLDRVVAQTRRGERDDSEEARMAESLGQRARDLEAALQQVRDGYDETLAALVSALDIRERETASHSHRVAIYSLMLAMRLGLHEEELEPLYRGALLHDIGKIGIPDAVLLKPGRFTEEEWDVMRTHVTIGADILRKIGFLRSACDVPQSHHEAWDGSGYPGGLVALDIPLHARIFAVVDSYDAIRSKRPYKEAKPHAEAIELLERASGSRLDPSLVQLFSAEPEETWQVLDKSVGGAVTFETGLRACTSVSEEPS
jgi:putative nucleotidyltransferase with HDIG domain